MSSRNKRHVHKYFKAKSNITAKGYLWTCALPGCSHHMPEHYESGLPGKFTMCWKCGESTILDDRTMSMEKPLCEDCDPNTFDIEKTTDVLTALGLVNKVTGE